MTHGVGTTVRDEPAMSRYEIRVGDELAGFAVYVRAPDRLIFVHTEIAPAWEGRGLGSSLARAALDDVRRQHLHLTPRCPFIRAFIERNPEYGELVAASPRTYFPSDR